MKPFVATSLRRWYTDGIRVMGASVAYFAREIGGFAVKSQMLWSLLVSFLLVCGTIRGAEKPDPDVEAAMEKAVAAQKECSQKLGLQVEITNSIGMKLRLSPAGEFMMGSPESDGKAQDNEKPQHKVRMIKPFYLGVCEVK